jgi:hypothetical protein
MCLWVGVFMPWHDPVMCVVDHAPPPTHTHTVGWLTHLWCLWWSLVAVLTPSLIRMEYAKTAGVFEDHSTIAVRSPCCFPAIVL